jgi:hypothetical protein
MRFLGLKKKPHIEWPREHGVFWGFLGLFGVGFQKKKEVPGRPGPQPSV